MSLRLALLLLTLGCAGCFGGTPDPPRYFTPQFPERASTAPTGSRTLLRLGRLASAEHLKARVVWRKSAVELGFYEQERWLEEPARFVARALWRELFERGPWRPGGREARLALDVELVALEEVLLPQHALRVALRASLRDEREVSLLERTFVAEEPVANEEAEAMAQAAGVAIDRALVALEQATREAAKALPPAKVR